jgi:hypothetical protein
LFTLYVVVNVRERSERFTAPNGVPVNEVNGGSEDERCEARRGSASMRTAKP